MTDAFGRALDDLGTVAERAKIDSLCMMAEDAMADPAEIARLSSTILQKLAYADPSRKLPVIYAIDAIAKRIGLPYQSQLSPRIVTAVTEAYDVLAPPLQHKIKTMVDTWLQARVFPDSARLLQEQLASRISYASGKRSRRDYEQPTANSYMHQPTPDFHVTALGTHQLPYAAHLPAYPYTHPAAPRGYGAPHYAPAQAVYIYGGHPYQGSHAPSHYDFREPLQPQPASRVAHSVGAPVAAHPVNASRPAIGGTLQSLLQKLRPDNTAGAVDFKGIVAPALAAISKVFWMAPGVGYSTALQPSAGSLDPMLTDVSMSTLSRRDMTPVTILYSLQPLRCNECTLRFQSTGELQQHREVHRSDTGKRSSSALQYRSWFVPEEVWVNPTKAAADNPMPPDDGGDAASETGASTSDSDNEHVVVVRIPNAACTACGEPFKRVWDDERQQYVYTGAVQVGGQLFHTACASSLDPFTKR